MSPTRRPAVVALAVIALFGCRPHDRPSSSPDGGNAEPASMRIVYPSAPGSFVKLARKASASVVHISTDVPVRDGPGDWFPGEISPSTTTETWTKRLQRALGSGFVIDDSGHVLTNAHIIGEGRALWVEPIGGPRLKAELVGRDDKSDLALLRVTPPKNTPLPAARLGRSDQLEVGEWVVALGNPFGVGYRVAAGVVSAMPRRDAPSALQSYWGYLQTDIEIHAGLSGGPLLNTTGEVVGITAALRSDTRGLGVALPVDVIKRVVPLLRRDGAVVRSWVGMYIDRPTPEQARAAGLETVSGAYITDVKPDGPASRAGLRPGDIVTAFDGKPIADAYELPWRGAAAGVGRSVIVEVRRADKKLSFTLRTARMPE